MEWKFHSLVTYSWLEFSAESNIYSSILISILLVEENTHTCAHESVSPFPSFSCASPAPRHSGCCSASLPTHHSHFMGARLDLLAIAITYGAALFCAVPYCDSRTYIYIYIPRRYETDGFFGILVFRGLTELARAFCCNLDRSGDGRPDPTVFQR